MLAGTFEWVAPPAREVRPVSPETNAEFTPAPKSFHYRKPPKAKSQPKQPTIVVQEADAPHMGHAAQIVNKQIRRPESTRTLHDPGLKRVASVLAQPKQKNMKDQLSEDPTRRLQALLKKS
jgi:cell envelope opacity-associated protein A